MAWLNIVTRWRAQLDGVPGDSVAVVPVADLRALLDMAEGKT